ncbi:MAG: glycosyltransferase family 4 protein [Micavibrio sp.]
MPATPPKFLLVVNDIAWFWSHRLPLAKDIMREGWDLHLATNNAGENTQIKELGITGHNLPRHTGSLNPLNQIKLGWRIFKILRRVKPEIVHAITLRHAFFTGIAAHLARTPRAVFTLAGLGPLFSSENPKIKIIRFFIVPLFRIAFGGAGRFVIFQNPDDARAMISCGAVKRERSIVIRGSGVDMNQFPFIPEPLNDVPVVLFPSRLLRAKGIGEFVHAVRILASKRIAARFQVAGDIWPGNHDSVTRTELENWKDENMIEWLGHTHDMPAVMAAANIVTLPSYYGEGVPKVLLEAAATGRAIVTTDMPGCREAVEDGITGLLIEPKDAWALADALEKLIHDRDRRIGMGRAGHARIEADFTVEKVNEATIGVYKVLMASS